MATYTLSSNTDPGNVILTDLDGKVAYKISTSYKFLNETITITRADELDIIAVIHWDKKTITMNGVTQKFGDVFPRASKLSSSRLVTVGDGDTFKWKYNAKLYCISQTTDLNVATFYRVWFGGRQGKKSTIDIAPCAVQHSDILVGKQKQFL